MRMCDPFGVGRGGGGSLLSAGGSFSTRPPAVTTSCVSFGDESKNIPYQQVPFGLTRLLLRASPPETKAKTSPLNKSHSVSHGYYFVHILRRQEQKPSFPYSLFPVPSSLFPIPYSLFPVPCSLLFITTQTDASPMAMLPMGDNRL